MNIGTNTTPIVAEPRALVPVADITAEEQTLLDKAARHRRTASRRRLIDRIIIIALILGIWEGVVAVGWIQPFFVSRPSLVMVDLWHLISTGYVFRHLAVTTYEALLGLLLGTGLGVLTGFAAALSPRLSDAFQPVIVASNSMPRVALAPLFIIWFGFGMTSKVALAALVVYFIVFFNTYSGMRSTDPVLVNTVRVMGASRLKVLWLVYLPVTLAWVFAAMKTAISNALVGAVVGEFVGSTAGLGWILVQAAGTNNTTRMFSTLFILAVFGALLFVVVRWTEDYFLHWRPRVEE